MENVISKEQARNLLIELTSKTPGELWEMYPERVKFEDKIVVDFHKASTEPDLVLKQFVDYLHIPKRKPWIVDKICQKIREELGLQVNQNKNNDVVYNY
jgi:hypothetical protein